MMSESSTPSLCMATTSFTPKAHAPWAVTIVSSKPPMAAPRMRFTIHLPSPCLRPGSCLARKPGGLSDENPTFEPEDVKDVTTRSGRRKCPDWRARAPGAAGGQGVEATSVQDDEPMLERPPLRRQPREVEPGRHAPAGLIQPVP